MHDKKEPIFLSYLLPLFISLLLLIGGLLLWSQYRNPLPIGYEVSVYHIDSASQKSRRFQQEEGLIGIVLYAYKEETEWECNGKACQSGDIIVKSAQTIAGLAQQYPTIQGRYQLLYRSVFGEELNKEVVGRGFSCYKDEWHFDDQFTDEANLTPITEVESTAIKSALLQWVSSGAQDHTPKEEVSFNQLGSIARYHISLESQQHATWQEEEDLIGIVCYAYQGKCKWQCDGKSYEAGHILVIPNKALANAQKQKEHEEEVYKHLYEMVFGESFTRASGQLLGRRFSRKSGVWQYHAEAIAPSTTDKEQEALNKVEIDAIKSAIEAWQKSDTQEYKLEKKLKITAS